MSRTLSPSRSFIANPTREPRAGSRGGLSMSNVNTTSRNEANTRLGSTRNARLNATTPIATTAIGSRPGSGSPTSAQKHAAAMELRETNVDAQCVRALFAALCTAIPEDVRLELLYDSTEELKFLIAIQPRLSAFGLRARHSLRHPALALATRKVYWLRHVKALEEAGEEDDEVQENCELFVETEAWHPADTNSNNNGRTTAAPNSPAPASRIAGNSPERRVMSPQPPVPPFYAATQRPSTERASQSLGDIDATGPQPYHSHHDMKVTTANTITAIGYNDGEEEEEEDEDEVGLLGHSASTLIPPPSTVPNGSNGVHHEAAAGTPRSTHHTNTQDTAKDGNKKSGKESETGSGSARAGQSSRPTGSNSHSNETTTVVPANGLRRPSNTGPLNARSRQYSIATSTNVSVHSVASRKSRKAAPTSRSNADDKGSVNSPRAQTTTTTAANMSPSTATLSVPTTHNTFDSASQMMRSAATTVRAAQAHSRNARNALDEEEKAVFHPILAKPRFQLLYGVTSYIPLTSGSAGQVPAMTLGGGITSTSQVPQRKAALEDADEQALLKLQEDEERRWARLATCYEQMLRVIYQARRTAALAVAQDATVNDIIRRFWERVTLSGRAVTAAEQQSHQHSHTSSSLSRPARRGSLSNEGTSSGRKDSGGNNNIETSGRREKKRRGNATSGQRGTRDTNTTDIPTNNNSSSGRRTNPLGALGSGGKGRKGRGRNESNTNNITSRRRRGGRNTSEFTPETSMTGLDMKPDDEEGRLGTSMSRMDEGRRTSRNANRQASLSTSNTLPNTTTTTNMDRRKTRGGAMTNTTNTEKGTKGKRNSGNNAYDGTSSSTSAAAGARKAAMGNTNYTSSFSYNSGAHHSNNAAVPENEVVYMSPMQYIYLHTRIAHVLLPRSVELEVEMLEAVQEDLLIDAAYRDDVAPQQLFFGRAPVLFTRTGVPLPNTPHPLNPLTIYTRRNPNSSGAMPHDMISRPGSATSSTGPSRINYASHSAQSQLHKGANGGTFPLTAYTLRAQQWSQERAPSTTAASPHTLSATVTGHDTIGTYPHRRIGSDDGVHNMHGTHSAGSTSNVDGDYVDDEEAEEEAALWNARRLPYVSFAQFWNAMLELADNWTCSAGKPAEYAAFLMELYAEVFGHDWDDEELEREVNTATWYDTNTFMTSTGLSASSAAAAAGSRPASASALSLYATGRADAVQQASMEVLRSFHNMVKSLEEMSSSDSGKEAEMHRSWFGEIETHEEATHRPSVDTRRGRTSELATIEAFNEDFERDARRVLLQESEWIYDERVPSAPKTKEEEEEEVKVAERVRRKRILLPSRRARMAASAARRQAAHESAMYAGTNAALAAAMGGETNKKKEGKRSRRKKDANGEDELSSFASSATLLSGHAATSLAQFASSAEGEGILLADDDDRTIDSALYSVYVIEEELDAHNRVIRRRRYHQKREDKAKEQEQGKEDKKRRFSLSLDEVVDEDADSSDEFQYVRSGSRGLLRQRVRFDARPHRTRRLDFGDRKDDYEEHAHDNLSAETSWSSFSLSRSVDDASPGIPRRHSDEEGEEQKEETSVKDKKKDLLLTLENRDSRRHHRRVRVRRVGKRRDMRREYRSPEYYYRGRRAEQAQTAKEVAAHLAEKEEQEKKQEEEEEKEEEPQPPTPLTEEQLNELLTKKMWLQKTLAAKGLPLADSLFSDVTKQSMLYKLLTAAEAQAARRARGEPVEEDVGIAGFDAELLARIFENTEFSLDELQRSELIRLLLETADEDGQPRMALSAGQMNDVLAALLQRRNANNSNKAALEPGSVRRHRERLIAHLEQQLVLFNAEGKARRLIEREREATLVMLDEKATAIRTRAIAEAAMRRETFGMTGLDSTARSSAARRRRASFAARLESADVRGRRNVNSEGDLIDEDDVTAMTAMSLARPTWATGDSAGTRPITSAAAAELHTPREMNSNELTSTNKLLPNRLTRAQRREQERLFREFEAFCAAQISHQGRYRVELTEYTPAQLQAFFVQLGLNETQRALLRGRAPLAAATSLVGGGIFHQLPATSSTTMDNNEKAMKPQVPAAAAETTRVLFQLAQPPRFYTKAPTNNISKSETVYLQPAPVKLFTLTTEPTLTRAMHESYDNYVQDRRFHETLYKQRGNNNTSALRGPGSTVVCPPLLPHGTPSSSSLLMTPALGQRRANNKSRMNKATFAKPNMTMTTTLPTLASHRHNLSHTAQPSSTLDVASMGTSSLNMQSNSQRIGEHDDVSESFASLSLSRSGSV